MLQCLPRHENYLSVVQKVLHIATIDAETAILNTAVLEVSAQMYQGDAQPGAQPGADAQAGEDIQDADFEEVK